MLFIINPDNPNQHKIQQVSNILKKGGIIIFPTDSVYALGCNIFNKKAVERICKIKGIKPEKANFSILCHDLGNISFYIQNIDKSLFRLLKKNLPGPFTFILNANNNVPKIFENKKKTIGIRIPDNKIAETIIGELGNSIVATSLHDEEDSIIDYMIDPELIHERYQKIVDVVIDGGYGGFIPSTVVNCTNEDVEIVRDGKGILEF